MPDYNFIMDSRLRPEQLKVVNQLGRLAANQGLILYLAGASARNLILGVTGARELSFVVEGNIQKVLRPLTSRAQRPETARPAPSAPGAADNGFDLKVESVNLDPKLNRVQLVFEGSVPAEIAVSRNATYGAPGKAPTFSPGTIFDDLRGRDFSIDAMAISLHPNSRGLLLDPTNGASDIERRELRALHSRSFFDEPVRIYRLLRLSQRLDFKLDEKTERWLATALEERTWEHVAEELQGAELKAILREDSAGKLLKQLKDRDLLAGLDRKLAGGRIEFDKFERIRTAVRTADASVDDALLLNFHALVAKLSGPDQDRLARKILREPKLVKMAPALEKEASQLAKTLSGPKVGKPSQVYTLLASSAAAQVLFLLVYDARPAVQNRVKAYFTKYLVARAGLPRAELRSLGLPAGPKFEKVMEQVFLDELDGKVKSPQHMTKLLMDYAGIKTPPPPPPPPAKTGKPAAKGPKPPPAKESVKSPDVAATPAVPVGDKSLKPKAAPQPKAEPMKPGKPAPPVKSRESKPGEAAKKPPAAVAKQAAAPASVAKAKAPAGAKSSRKIVTPKTQLAAAKKQSKPKPAAKPKNTSKPTGKATKKR